MTDYALPSHYGPSRVSRLLPRWEGTMRGRVERMGPRVWPGTPPIALVAFSTNSTGQHEDTGGAVVNGHVQRFHEVGLFNTPAGLWPGPAPNPDPRAAHNTWGRLAGSSRVRELLGRAAVMGDGAWRDAPEDQTAIGLVDYRQGAEEAAAAIPEDLRPTDGTQWGWALGAMAYVMGSGTAAGAVRRYSVRLRGVPEPSRFGALARALAEDPGASSAHARAVLRTWHRLATGEALARRVQSPDLPWFSTGLGADQGRVEAGVLAAYRAGRSAATGAAPGAAPGTFVPRAAMRRGSLLGWLVPPALVVGSRAVARSRRR